MQFKSVFILLFLGLTTHISNPIFAQDSLELIAAIENDSSITLDSADLASLSSYYSQLDSIEKAMNYEKGNIDIAEGVATLTVPEGFKYLNPKQSEYILGDIWGNPPSESLGMLFLDSAGPYNMGSYVIEITYEEMGYVKDDDAEDLDYSELLEEMQSDIKETNVYREENGYETVQLVGWASEPYYDSEGKKLHWAKELKFGEDEVNTLNYAVRFLGRKGVLQMNFISDIDALTDVKNVMPEILKSTEFKDDYSYSAFDPDLDDIAAVGIGGLIAGKVLAKVGFFALIIKFWKFIAIGVVGVFGFIWKRMKGEA